jgi:hypothetical protein
MIWRISGIAALQQESVFRYGGIIQFRDDTRHHLGGRRRGGLLFD